MSRNRMRFVWITALAYPAMMAALWLSTSHSYQDAHLIMRDRWWFIAGIASVTLAMAKLSGTKINHSRRLGGISWLLIVCVAIVVVGGVQTIHEPGTDSQVAAATILGTFFVGIGEEVAYRGIVFNLLAQRYSIIKTVIASSLLFGLLHAVNVIVQDAQATMSQVVITTIQIGRAHV